MTAEFIRAENFAFLNEILLLHLKIETWASESELDNFLDYGMVMFKPPKNPSLHISTGGGGHILTTLFI